MGRVIYWDNRMWFEEPLRLGPLLLYQAGEAYISGYLPVDIHKQFCYEINFVQSGRCVHLVGDQRYQLSKGEIAIVPPGILHGMEVAEGDNLRYWFLAFDFDESHPDFENFREMRDFYRKNSGCQVQHSHSLQGFFSTLLEEVGTMNKMHIAMLYSLVTQILVKVYRDYADLFYRERGGIPSESVEGRIVYSIIHYIDAHYMEMDHLNEIADKLGYSYPYLARVFIKMVGMSIGDYYKRKRFEEAVNMLKENVPVAIIAEKLGYSSVGAFSKAFSAYFKMPPSAYKKEILNN